jgi:hypothetical protein
MSNILLKLHAELAGKPQAVIFLPFFDKFSIFEANNGYETQLNLLLSLGETGNSALVNAFSDDPADDFIFCRNDIFDLPAEFGENLPPPPAFLIFWEKASH